MESQVAAPPDNRPVTAGSAEERELRLRQLRFLYDYTEIKHDMYDKMKAPALPRAWEAHLVGYYLNDGSVGLNPADKFEPVALVRAENPAAQRYRDMLVERNIFYSAVVSREGDCVHVTAFSTGDDLLKTFLTEELKRAITAELSERWDELRGAGLIESVRTRNVLTGCVDQDAVKNPLDPSNIYKPGFVTVANDSPGTIQLARFSRALFGDSASRLRCLEHLPRPTADLRLRAYCAAGREGAREAVAIPYQYCLPSELPHGTRQYCSEECRGHHQGLLATARASGAGIDTTNADHMKLVNDGRSAFEHIARLVEHLNAPAGPGDPGNEAEVKKSMLTGLTVAIDTLNIMRHGVEGAVPLLTLVAKMLRDTADLAERDPRVGINARLARSIAESLDTMISLRAKRAPEQSLAPEKRLRPDPPPAEPPAHAAPPAAPPAYAAPPARSPPAAAAPPAHAPFDPSVFIAEINAAIAGPEPRNDKLAKIEKMRKKMSEMFDAIVNGVQDEILRHIYDAARHIAVAFTGVGFNRGAQAGSGYKVDKEIVDAGKALDKALVRIVEKYGSTPLQESRVGPGLWVQLMSRFELGAFVASQPGNVPVPNPNRQDLSDLENRPDGNAHEIMQTYVQIAIRLIAGYYAMLTTEQWKKLEETVNVGLKSGAKNALDSIYKGTFKYTSDWISEVLNKMRVLRGADVIPSHSKNADGVFVLDPIKLRKMDLIIESLRPSLNRSW